MVACLLSRLRPRWRLRLWIQMTMRPLFYSHHVKHRQPNPVVRFSLIRPIFNRLASQSPLSTKMRNQAPLSFGTAYRTWIWSKMARPTFESNRQICSDWLATTAWSWPVLRLIARSSPATSWRWLRVIGASQRGMECTKYRHDHWVMNDATLLEPLYYSNWTGHESTRHWSAY